MDGAHESCTICGGDSPHSQGLAITPSRACLGVGTDESATFSVTGDSYVQSPSWSLSPEVEGGPTLSASDGSATVSPGTTNGVFTVTASGEGCSASATVVVYAVDYLTIESEAFPADQAVVQFPGMMPHPFNVTNSPIPDLHQPFFYKDAQTNFVVQPFTTVTNLWYEGHKSNVFAIAEQRLAANSNDLVGAIMMFDYDLEFSNEGNYSNDVRRIFSFTNNLPIGTFVNNIDLVTSALNGFLDYLSSNPMTPAEIQKDKSKALIIHKPMSNEILLKWLHDDGLF